MPLDDRKDILLGILGHLQASVSGLVVFPRAAVGSWSAHIVQAAIFVLCRAPANTSLRTLRSASGQFDTSTAADVLFDNTLYIYPTDDERVEVRDFLLKHCWENQDAILERACVMGFDYSEVVDRSLLQGTARIDSRSGQPGQFATSGHRPYGGPSASGAAVGRMLRPMSVDEEMEHLIKRKKLFEMRETVQRAETELVHDVTKVAGVAGSFPADRRLPVVPQTSPDMIQVMAMSLDPGCFNLPDVLTVPSNQQPRAASDKLQTAHDAVNFALQSSRLRLKEGASVSGSAPPVAALVPLAAGTEAAAENLERLAEACEVKAASEKEKLDNHEAAAALLAKHETKAKSITDLTASLTELHRAASVSGGASPQQEFVGNEQTEVQDMPAAGLVRAEHTEVRANFGAEVQAKSEAKHLESELVDFVDGKTIVALRAELAEALAATKPVLGPVALAKAAAFAQSAADAQAKIDERRPGLQLRKR